MIYLYEGMFLIDNDLVRAGWSGAKAAVRDLLAKNGASIKTLRRWEERALTYSIGGKRRGTFVLAYFELEGGNMQELNRDLELKDGILRHLVVRCEGVPETELQLSEAELAPDFVVPEPPADDYAPEEPSLLDENEVEEIEVPERLDLEADVPVR